jgi:hypothetical protein
MYSLFRWSIFIGCAPLVPTRLKIFQESLGNSRLWDFFWKAKNLNLELDCKFHNAKENWNGMGLFICHSK